jgi:hypothetical protein
LSCLPMGNPKGLLAPAPRINTVGVVIIFYHPFSNAFS